MMNMMNMTNWMKKNGSWILTILASVGVVGTSVLAARAGRKAEQAAAKVEAEKGTELTVPERVQAELPEYLTAIGCGAATIGCMIGAQCLNKRNEAAVLASLAAMERAFGRYRKNVGYLEGAHAEIGAEKATALQERDLEDNNPPWEAVQTFYLEGYERPIFFERTMEQVFKAEYHLNRNFALNGYVTWNEFLEFLGLPMDENGERLGWDAYIGETIFGYFWIDFNHRHYVNDDGLLVCAIDMPFPPHPLDENEYETGLVEPSDFDKR